MHLFVYSIVSIVLFVCSNCLKHKYNIHLFILYVVEFIFLKFLCFEILMFSFSNETIKKFQFYRGLINYVLYREVLD